MFNESIEIEIEIKKYEALAEAIKASIEAHQEFYKTILKLYVDENGEFIRDKLLHMTGDKEASLVEVPRISYIDIPELVTIKNVKLMSDTDAITELRKLLNEAWAVVQSLDIEDSHPEFMKKMKRYRAALE